MADFTIRQADTKPYFATTLLNPDGTVLDLTGATIEFSMRKQPSSSFIVSSTISGTCAIVGSPTLGQVAYQWSASDTALPGWYNALFTVTFLDGSVESFPNKTFLTIEVTKLL